MRHAPHRRLLEAAGRSSSNAPRVLTTRRRFQDYFVTHIPKSSLHPDSSNSSLLRRHLPGAIAKPHDDPESSSKRAPALDASPDTATVRIPLRGAKHHFGAAVSRGSRPYNEDAYQAGVIDIPAFAKRPPGSVTVKKARSSVVQHGGSSDPGSSVQEDQKDQDESTSESPSDPQTFYFGVFDGHGGVECSGFLSKGLHTYIEKAAKQYNLRSTLQPPTPPAAGQQTDSGGAPEVDQTQLQSSLVSSWRQLVGGYFRRFAPVAFKDPSAPSIDTMLTYAFLCADLDFIETQVRRMRSDSDPVRGDSPINVSDIHPHTFKPILPGDQKPFKGGSTCSVAFISTPTPTPFWNPATSATLLTAHCGDTRILLSRVSDGAALPLTTNHHPSTPSEATRLRRFATSLVTDSFGEERLAGVANTRAFGDIGSKSLGIVAEPELRTTDLGPGEYAFLCLVSDGVSGTMADQEVVDVVKEAKTPEQGARDVVAYATEVSEDGDNATCLVVRLGGWERRQEGGGGSLGTKEGREWRRREALDPRGRRT